MAGFDFEGLRPDAVEGLERRRAGCRGRSRCCCGRRTACLRPSACESWQSTPPCRRSSTCGKPANVGVHVLRPVGAADDLRAGIAGDAELGVELGQGRFDALPRRWRRRHRRCRRRPSGLAEQAELPTEAGIRFDDGRVVGRGENRPSELVTSEPSCVPAKSWPFCKRAALAAADDLAVGQRDRDALFQRQVPEFLELGIAERQRPCRHARRRPAAAASQVGVSACVALSM